MKQKEKSTFLLNWQLSPQKREMPVRMLKMNDLSFSITLFFKNKLTSSRLCNVISNRR